VDNNCAIIYKDYEYKVMSSREEAKAYRVMDSEQGVVVTQIEEHPSYRPLQEVYGGGDQ
jgi:dipeptidase E